jgi:hypothetical protein
MQKLVTLLEVTAEPVIPEKKGPKDAWKNVYTFECEKKHKFSVDVVSEKETDRMELFLKGEKTDYFPACPQCNGLKLN